MKRLIPLLLAAMLLCLPVAALAEGEAERSVTGGIFKLTTEADFQAGTLDALIIDPAVGDGALRLTDGASEGTFTSDIIGTEAFEYLVASWNADVPKGASVEILARVFVDMKNEWSAWSSFGLWQPEIKRASTDDDDPLSYMDVDTLTVKGSSGETASRVQLKAVLKSGEQGASPVLRQIAATYRNTLDAQAITPVYYGEAMPLPARVQLDTPAYSQGIRERSIASSMCSATTIAVLLNDRGEDVLPEEIALACYDSVYDGFGNWAYSVAAAGAYGYDAYCQFADLDVLRQELAHGYSVGLSVKYARNDGTSYPYLAGAPIESTNGHLITVTGYETVDGVDYFFASDSAATGDEACFLRYRADQLDNAWTRKLAYIVHDKEASAAPLSPNRIQATLTPVAGQENIYSLTVNGEPVALNKNFSATKLKTPGSGIIAFYIEDAPGADIPATAKATSANRIFRYTIQTRENDLRIDPATVLAGVDGVATLHIFVMLNDGTTYETSLAIDEANSPTPAPTTAPTDAPSAAPSASDAPDIPADTSAKAQGVSWLIYMAAALAVLVLSILLISRGKRRKRK